MGVFPCFAVYQRVKIGRVFFAAKKQDPKNRCCKKDQGFYYDIDHRPLDLRLDAWWSTFAVSRHTKMIMPIICFVPSTQNCSPARSKHEKSPLAIFVSQKTKPRSHDSNKRCARPNERCSRNIAQRDF